MKSTTVDYDSAWKTAITTYLPQCLQLLFPEVYEGIDWSKDVEFLDKEMQKLARDAKVGKRYLDNLIKVQRKTGDEAWVLLHIEVQSQVDVSFSQRMYNYHAIASLRYVQQVVSLAILGDENAQWRPKDHLEELWHCGVRFWFPTNKLADYRQRWEELENSNNPFAVVVMAYLKAQETKDDMEERLHWKLLLVKWLYERGYSKEEVMSFMRYDKEKEFSEKIEELEEEKQMEYVTSFERRGKQEGALLATQDSVITVLSARFGEPSQATIEQMEKIQDIKHLKKLLKKAALAASLSDFERSLK